MVIKQHLKSTYRWLRNKKEARHHLFEGLGSAVLPRGAPRCLVGYVPGLVGVLARSLKAEAWAPGPLASKLDSLSRPFDSHTMFWESAELVRQCIEQGYVVDYVDGRRGYLIENPTKYDLIIDEWTNLPDWAKANPHSKKLFYATGAHWLFSNMAELTRHAWLLARRGIDVPTQRAVPPLLAPQYADLVTSFGNKTINNTFGPSNSKIRRLQISAVDSDVPLARKDWAVARRSFMWFGGGGWLHKGLDLVIEAFLRERSLHLHIVGGGVEADEHFEAAYGVQLRASKNITVHGFLDVRARDFSDLARKCASVIYPSASEGCSGAVIQCLHHGLLPLVTPTAGIEEMQEWPFLSAVTDKSLIDEIIAKCGEIAGRPDAHLGELQACSREFAQANHSRRAYRQSLSAVLEEILT